MHRSTEVAVQGRRLATGAHQRQGAQGRRPAEPDLARLGGTTGEFGDAAELVIRGGVNIYPREVEEVLVRHPAVSEVAVIGVPDEKRSEEICAVVVARTDAGPVTADELIAWSRERLGRHTYPRIVRFTEALPLGPTGKVLKLALTASS